MYKAIWCWLDRELASRLACKTMVGILALAHREDCQQQLGEYLQVMMAGSTVPSLLDLQRRFGSREKAVPNIQISHPQASGYDVLLSNCVQGVH